MTLVNSIDALVTALRWYADEENYDQGGYSNENVPGIELHFGRCSRCGLDGCRDYFEPDRGYRAREALARALGIKKCAHGRFSFHCEFCKEKELAKQDLETVLR